MSLQEFSDNLSTLSYVSRRRVPLWLYDSKKKTFLGRTACSWALCLLFYLVYYVCLAGFFLGMLMIFLHTCVPTDQPARTGEHNIMQMKPGLGMRPVVDVQKSLIKYASTDPQSYLVYTENINSYLETYHAVNSKPDDQFAKCDENAKVPDDPSKVCKFSLDKLGTCNSANNYNFPDSAPCFILKMNKVYGWLPDIERSNVSSGILVSCTGQNPADVENLGELEYYPGVEADGKKYGVFDSLYFPFLGQPGYLAPLVAVHFKSVVPHVAILIECQLSNVKNAYEGRLAFELLID